MPGASVRVPNNVFPTYPSPTTTHLIACIFFSKDCLKESIQRYKLEASFFLFFLSNIKHTGQKYVTPPSHAVIRCIYMSKALLSLYGGAKNR